jgi:hypothetical protein
MNWKHFPTPRGRLSGGPGTYHAAACIDCLPPRGLIGVACRISRVFSGPTHPWMEKFHALPRNQNQSIGRCRGVLSFCFQLTTQIFRYPGFLLLHRGTLPCHPGTSVAAAKEPVTRQTSHPSRTAARAPFPSVPAAAEVEFLKPRLPPRRVARLPKRALAETLPSLSKHPPSMRLDCQSSPDGTVRLGR